MRAKLFIGYIAFISLLTALLGLVPGHNGDLGYYIACVIEKSEGPRNLFQKTSDVLLKELPPQEFTRHHERLMNSDPGILDFYRVKPVYILLITLLHSLGFSYIFSTLIPSLLSYLGIGLLTFRWASLVLQPVLALLSSMLIMMLYPAITLARLSTPDALSHLVLLGSLYSIYFGKKIFLPVLLLLLSVLIRMDNIVAVFVILTAMRFLPVGSPGRRLTSLSYPLLLLTAAGLAFSMNYFLETDFWWFTRISYLDSGKQYGRQVLLYFLTMSASLLVVLILFFVITYFSPGKKMSEKTKSFLLMLLLVVVARILLFPSFEERFLTAYYISAILILAESVSGIKTGEVIPA